MPVRLLVFYALLFGLAAAAQAQIPCTGKASGPQGKLLPAAHVRLLGADGMEVLKTVRASRDGRYALTVPHAGFFRLRFSGVGYADQSVLLYAPGPAPIELHVSLGGCRYLPGEPELTVIGDFNLWNAGTGVPLQKNADGTWTAVVPASRESISVRIRGLRDGDAVEGIRHAAFVLNQEGSYDARIRAPGGQARVTLDPAQFDRSRARASVVFTRGTEQTRRIASVAREWWDGEDAYLTAQIDGAMKRAGADSARPDWNALMASLERQAATERDSLIHAVLALACVSTSLKARHLDAGVLTRHMEELPASSPVWGINPGALSPAVRRTTWSDQQRERYVAEALSGNPVRSVHVAVLFNEFMIAFSEDKDAKAAQYYDTLLREYPESPEARQIKKYQRPDPGRN